SDNSDTSNTSIASASGSAGYGGNTVSGGSSTHAVSPKDVCLTVTSGSALIDISNSDGGCINPAYDNGEGSHSRQAGNSFTVSEGPQKSKLCELLDSYNKEIPKSTSSSSNFNNPEYVDALVGLRNLPQCWTDIVNCAGKSKHISKLRFFNGS
uniref:Uncharacterized protein n=1 Tax=Anopheles melas TaxID=34690 RepID=A0A182U7W1_9DIPT